MRSTGSPTSATVLICIRVSQSAEAAVRRRNTPLDVLSVELADVDAELLETREAIKIGWKPGKPSKMTPLAAWGPLNHEVEAFVVAITTRCSAALTAKKCFRMVKKS